MNDIGEADLTFLRKAISLACTAVEEGNRPFAAVLVGRDGAILAEDCDRTSLSGDPFSHGELNVLRAAIIKHGLEHVSGATLYVSGEPCTMCAGAIVRCGVGRLIYGAPGGIVGPYISAKRLGQRYPSASIFGLAGSHLEVMSGVLLEEAKRPLELYLAKGSA
jgi:tRNA(Arg) A34 adenosine deaminase TadA